MLQPADLKAKSDAELLQIWRDQVDYREDVVAWVEHEIAERKLDTASVHVDTIEEKVQAETTQEKFKGLLLLAIFQGICGFVTFLMAAVAAFSETGVILWMAFLLMAVGGLLVGIAVGVLKRQRWAFTASMILWGFTAALDALTFLTALTRIQGEPAVLGMLVLRFIISILLARAYFRMRDKCPPAVTPPTPLASEDIPAAENADTVGPS